MTHHLASAKEHLVELEAAVRLPVQQRAAAAILLLPRTAEHMASLIKCCERLTISSKSLRKELREAVNDMRNDIWANNEELAKVIGRPGHIVMKVGPLSRHMRRVLELLEQIEEAAAIDEGCGK